MRIHYSSDKTDLIWCGRREPRVERTTVVVDRPWAADVRSALAGMDGTQSRVIRMVYFERQTQQQVAQRLALPVPAISHMLALGMQALARLMSSASRPVPK